MLTTSFTNCTHEFLVNYGWSRTLNTKQRKRCVFCGRRFTIGKQRMEREHYIRLYAPLFRDGYDPVRAAAIVGGNPKTARRWFRWFNAKLPEHQRRSEPFVNLRGDNKREMWKNRTSYRGGRAK